MRLAFILMAMSGCSLIVGDGTGVSNLSTVDSGASDGEVIAMFDGGSADAEYDSSPAACSVYTDDGCGDGRTCKDPVNPGCLEILDTGQDGESCGFVSDCDTGLGCYMARCRYYCGPSGECFNGGYCVGTYCVP